MTADLYAAYTQAQHPGTFADWLDEQDAEREHRLAQPDALANAAAWYAGAGIAVFPCEVRGKRPLTRNGFKDATTDVEQVAAWWRAEPQANIGLPTGHLFDVVDIDGPQGHDSISRDPDNPDDPAPDYDKTWWGQFTAEALGIAWTGNGAHIYIPARPNTGNATHLLPGVDYRGLSGYVIAPPSRHASGSMYRWSSPLEVPS